MSETTTVAVAKRSEPDSRVDESAANMFGDLGFDRSKLPDGLVTIYNDFRRVKDRIRPGNLSAEGYAFVVTLYRTLGE